MTDLKPCAGGGHVTSNDLLGGTQLRETEFDGQKLYLCPHGCPKEEIERGRATNTGAAVFGFPQTYLRCGKCGFGDENGRDNTKYDLTEAIQIWNAHCEFAVTPNAEAHMRSRSVAE